MVRYNEKYKRYKITITVNGKLCFRWFASQLESRVFNYCQEFSPVMSELIIHM